MKDELTNGRARGNEREIGMNGWIYEWLVGRWDAWMNGWKRQLGGWTVELSPSIDVPKELKEVCKCSYPRHCFSK